ncbi:MAG TPA: hypothetical protein VG323_13020 [Thermoanaerobaculia bacterium]|nr:hypothetical protein [Thermoanaerobaculia bacterium]
MKYAVAAFLFLFASAQYYKPQVGVHVGNPELAYGPRPIAIHAYEVSGVEVALWEVRRTGPDAVTVKWSYVNMTAQRKQLTGEPKSLSLGPHETLKTSSKFAAPAGMNTITVRIPGAEPFENVPIR